MKKCELGKAYVKFLGHVAGSGELHMDLDKVAAVLDWELPTDIKGVKQFLGFANYYNRLLKSFAYIAAPILNLLSASSEFMWGDAQ